MEGSVALTETSKYGTLVRKFLVVAQPILKHRKTAVAILYRKPVLSYQTSREQKGHANIQQHVEYNSTVVSSIRSPTQPQKKQQQQHHRFFAAASTKLQYK